MKLGAKKINDQRQLLMVDGEPGLVRLVTRPSRDFPTRVKAALIVPMGDAEDDGEESAMPLPYAEPRVPTGPFPPSGFTFEWKMEMN